MSKEIVFSDPKIFSDSSRIEEIDRMIQTGLIYGITTNPIIVAKEASTSKPNEYYKKLADRFPELPISIQLLDGNVSELIRQASEYADISPNIVIKVPMFEDGRGLKVIKDLTKKKIKINVTALMNTPQLLMAILAGRENNIGGPSYLSLFYNRIKDGEGDPNKEIKKSKILLRSLGAKSEIIVGSIRKGEDVTQAFRWGAHIATITPKVFWSMIFNDQSEKFISQCLKDWNEFLNKQSSKH